VTTGATTGETDAEFQLGGTVTQAWARTYLRFSALPSATVRVLRLLNGTASTCLNVRLTATGVVQIADTANGANNASSTTTLAANTWYRLEMRVANSTSVGVGEVKIFTSVDSATPAETVTSAASWNTSAACDRVRFGNAAGTANWGPFWYDDVGISDVGYMGPSVVAGLPELVMAPMTG
jgi:hypothetical protein